MRKVFPFFFHIRTKLIISYAAIIVFTILVISVVFFTAAKQIITRHVLDMDQFLAEQLAANLASQLKSMEELQFSQYSYSLLGDLLAYDSPGNNVSINQGRRISECITRLCYSKGFIEGAMVTDNNGNIYSQNIGKAYDISGEAAMADPGELIRNYGKAIWSIGSNGRLLMHRLLININTTRAVGKMTLAINPQYLTGVYWHDMAGTRGQVLIFDRDGNFIPSADTEINSMAHLLFESKETNDAEFSNNGKQYIITRAQFPGESFQIFHVLSLNELSIYTKTLLLMTSLAAIAAIIATIIVAHILSNQVTGGINSLIKGIRRFAGGDLKTPVQVRSKDEIGFLAVEFNRMADSINSLIANIYDAEQKKRNAETNALRFEYSALESKINPHFIYNTLESVNSLAKLKGAGDISKIVCLLGNLLRDTISSTIDIIPLEKEIDNVYRYLQIQKLAYGEKFDIHINIPEDLLEAGVPKFILQPLIENALYHGILVNTKHGNLYLSARKEDDNLTITLTDDGIGMSKEKLALLLDYSAEVRDDNAGHTKVGVRAVDKRLKILYGAQYGLKIESEENAGTTVFLNMPFINAGIESWKADNVQYSDI